MSEEKRYGVICADPPWCYENMKSAIHGAASSAMSVMDTRAIRRIRAARWAADDCVLAMWGTWPKLRDGMAVVRSWGFRYVTAFPWLKTMPAAHDVRSGIGFWTRSVSEVVLIGVIGEPKRRTPREDTPLGLLVGDDRVFVAPRPSRHSQKPEGLQDWLEDTFAGPYVELFARRKRAGWDAWGLETGFVLGPDGVRAARADEVAAAPAATGDLFAGRAGT